MSTQVETSQQVFEHHFGALGVGDLPDILSDFTEESVVIHPGGVAKGIEAIREFYAPFRPGCSSPALTSSTSTRDTFVVRDGKIAVQTVVAKIEPHS